MNNTYVCVNQVWSYTVNGQTYTETPRGYYIVSKVKINLKYITDKKIGDC